MAKAPKSTAALLHDAIEDQEVPADIIAAEFGQDVTALVEEVSDDKELPKEERKRLQIENAPDKSPEAKLIKLADKISNLRAIALSPSPTRSVKRRLEYIAWSKSVVQGMRGTQGLPDAYRVLEEKFNQAASDAERSVHTPSVST